jgi:hypothetical protein
VLRFDGTRPVTVRGVVSGVVWGNPHAYIAVDVPASDGQAGERWIIESESPIVLQRLGWMEGSVKRGDRVWSIGAPAKDGERIMRCDFVETSGVRLPCHPAGAVSSLNDSRPHYSFGTRRSG